ncbi:MAG: hypothetical protein MZU97_16945 [Bacillus subtilis]|nr:hypothetical protein [Bacillus subtilis]
MVTVDIATVYLNNNAVIAFPAVRRFDSNLSRTAQIHARVDFVGGC